ncbi:MAG TPA: EAL domain-containing protein, partial [Novosphingobium sp.]|nr:EAL domain-containing protein [Novosphingobium sp.]
MRALLKQPLAIALAFAMACWSLLLTEGVEFIYWNQYYKHLNLIGRSAPVDAVIVSVDTGGENLVGSPGRQAQVLRKVLAASPGHVFADLPATMGSDRAADAEFFRAVEGGGSAVDVVLRGSHDSSADVGQLSLPHTPLPPLMRVVASVWTMNFYGYAIAAPPAVQVDGRIFPSIVGNGSDQRLADRSVVPDFAVDPAAVPVFSAAQILSDAVAARHLAGKTVFITSTSPEFSTQIGYLGQGRRPVVYADIAGIRGAEAGVPSHPGGLPLLVGLLVMIALAQRIRHRGVKTVAYGGVVLVMLVAPPLLMEHRIITSNGPALLALLAYAPARIWQKWQRHATMTNGRSGLPNIEALVTNGIPEGFDVVAASIERFDEILSSLPRELHGECSRQIARRLSLASGDSRVYSTDNGHFAWLDEPRSLESLVAHLEGLRALFSAPLVIGDHLLDTNIHFGIDRISTGAPVRRVQAALASANEALAKGKLYEEYEERRMAEASWELSLHARIDEGLRNGDIWLALQPQLDIRTGRIAAAEALIRWSDPERGMIPPDAFILQAERAGRIEAITY